jgi:hypothetical protein
MAVSVEHEALVIEEALYDVGDRLLDPHLRIGIASIGERLEAVVLIEARAPEPGGAGSSACASVMRL